MVHRKGTGELSTIESTRLFLEALPSERGFWSATEHSQIQEAWSPSAISRRRQGAERSALPQAEKGEETSGSWVPHALSRSNMTSMRIVPEPGKTAILPAECFVVLRTTSRDPSSYLCCRRAIEFRLPETEPSRKHLHFSKGLNHETNSN